MVEPVQHGGDGAAADFAAGLAVRRERHAEQCCIFYVVILDYLASGVARR